MRYIKGEYYSEKEPFELIRFFNNIEFDENELRKNLPDDMRLEHKNVAPAFSSRNSYDLRLTDLNWNNVYPFKMPFPPLYQVLLRGPDDTYVGIYNPIENKWAIPPIKEFEGGRFVGFEKTEYADWIAREDSDNTVFNIKTRKKYTYVYTIVRGNMTHFGYPDYGYYASGIVYRGFAPIVYSSGYKQEVIVEDF